MIDLAPKYIKGFCSRFVYTIFIGQPFYLLPIAWLGIWFNIQVWIHYELVLIFMAHSTNG